MKILDLNLTRESGFVTASARVIFEECARPEKEVYIKTPLQFANGFEANPDAFLVGCLLPALHLGEKRIFMDQEICPFLKEGLGVAMKILSHWTKGRYAPIGIEAKTRKDLAILSPPRTGMVMSGGMDSLAALRLNRLNYPKGHPGYVKDSFFLHGFDIGGVEERGSKYHVFDRAMDAILKITRDAGTSLVPVYTNIRHLCDERELWLNSFFGAVLAAMAHTFGNRINLMFVGSSYDIPNLHPCGSHPLLDPEYSSYGLRIRHRDYEMSRLEKIQIVSQWDTAFQNFRVCLANVSDQLNCGKCEKCVRTMTELTALGVLQKTRAFAADEVTPSDIEQFDITIRVRPPFYQPLIPLLRQKGRKDLADTIERLLKKAP
ncbi:MAG: hypothetical protein KKF12_08375 [Proteobacteria bacterium]|nr:hypothetical protein [Desulfobacula sp.]MBU3952474.1 hypothetical protein [Pseudomonadota bacterium]MBU4130821.1 hypothetical protein [Pseudomonadota bacterium]